MSIQKRKVYVANVSGGKDSLYMLKIILENPNLYPLHYVVHYDIGINNPIENKVFEYMKKNIIRHTFNLILNIMQIMYIIL